MSVESAKWGERFTLLEPQGKRGISHGDVVDLNRENIRGFDVREFYVKLAADLKRRGYRFPWGSRRVNRSPHLADSTDTSPSFRPSKCLTIG